MNNTPSKTNNRKIVSGKALAFRPEPDVASMLTKALRDHAHAPYSKIVNRALRKHLVECGYAGKRELSMQEIA